MALVQKTLIEIHSEREEEEAQLINGGGGETAEMSTLVISYLDLLQSDACLLMMQKDAHSSFLPPHVNTSPLTCSPLFPKNYKHLHQKLFFLRNLHS